MSYDVAEDRVDSHAIDIQRNARAKVKYPLEFRAMICKPERIGRMADAIPDGAEVVDRGAQRGRDKSAQHGSLGFGGKAAESPGVDE